MEQAPHFSVMLPEVLALFEPIRLRVMVDGTLGAGGHASALLAAHPELERFIGIDKDPCALEIAGKRLAGQGDKVELVRGGFDQLFQVLAERGIASVEGLLLDLGVSSMQLDRGEKGFSFRREGPLDMRMDPDQSLSAADIVNFWEERELIRLFRDYGEEPLARRFAGAVIRRRGQRPFDSTLDLANLIEEATPKAKREKIHPATRVFQALRIAVNDELGALERFLDQAIEWLSPGGRLAIISFHSLEDRLVKRAFQQAASDKVSTSGVGGVFQDKEPLVRLVTRKPLGAGEEELDLNPRSRSAKLRAVEKF